jgi:hypothetical protein
MITLGFFMFFFAAIRYLALVEKVTFVFLNEHSLRDFISVTTGVLLKHDLSSLAVECNCSGNECSEGIIQQAQKDYGAIAIRERREN